MHGQFPHNLDIKLMDIEQLYQQLKSEDIKGETESSIVAAQEQAINKTILRIKFLKEKTDSKFRTYRQHEEAIDHLISWCHIVANNEYLMRHDKICAHVYYSICKALGIETSDILYTHTHTNQFVSSYQ
jgi:hypothetical protein